MLERLHLPIRPLVALVLAAFALLVATGCGSDVPPNAVAKIGDDGQIETKDFEHWLKAAASSQAPPVPGQEIVVPDPPNFEKCVAAGKKQPQPEGAPKQDDKALKDQCKMQYEGLRDQVMQFLITSEWIQQEAKARDAEVSDEEVRKQFDEQKKMSFPEDAQYQEFLKTSGQTEEDLLFRVRIEALLTKVREKVVEGKGEVTDEDIAKYYEENKSKPPIATPESRDLSVVLTENEEDANEAKSALDSGQAFPAVAKKFSIDEGSKSQGGKLPGVVKGQQEKPLDDAVFGASEGELTGPVKTTFGFYVFKVDTIAPAKMQPLEEAKDTIKNLLKTQREQKALDDFIKSFQEKYKEETVCREDYVVQECKNAPKEDTGSTPASGAPPQGAPPQGAPPQGAPPQGVPPQQVPPQGAPPQQVPPQGAPPQGAPPPQQVPPQGAPPQGAPPPQQVPVPPPTP